MFRKPLLALLSTLALAQGCIIIGDNDPPPNTRDPGDVTFAWTFTGLDCAAMPEVADVRITIPGESLAQDGIYACRSAGFDGITLHDFVGGTYAYTVEGLDNTGTAIFEKSGSFTIDGNVDVAVDLDAIYWTYSYVTWRLPAVGGNTNPTCAEADVTHVDIWINDLEPVRVPCELGRSGEGYRTPFLEADTHYIYLRATDVDAGAGLDYGRYYKESELVTLIGSASESNYQLQPYGGATLKWELYETGGSGPYSCADLGVTDVYINFQNVDTSEWVYHDGTGVPTTGDKRPCTDVVAYYDELIPGDYTVSIQGRGTGDVLYTNASMLAGQKQVTVTGGVFPADQAAKLLYLYPAE